MTSPDPSLLTLKVSRRRVPNEDVYFIFGDYCVVVIFLVELPDNYLIEVQCKQIN